MKILRYKDGDELADTLAKEIAVALNNTEALLVLPGGSSPRKLMVELARGDINWNNVTVTTSDERCVPPDHPESNAGQVERIMGKMPRLIRLWDDGKIPDTLPYAPTVAVLGIGEDGHFASIFPGQIWDETKTTPYSVTAPKEPKNRVTLPVQFLLQSKRLILLVCGAEKMRLCEDIFNGLHADLPVAKLIARRDDIELHMTDMP